MKLEAKITTIGMSKGFIIPKNIRYEDGTEIKKGDKVIVEIKRVRGATGTVKAGQKA